MCGSKRVEAKPCCHCLPPQLPLNHMCWKCVHCGDPIVSEGCGLVQVTPWGRVAHRSLIKPRDAGRVVKTRPGSEHINRKTTGHADRIRRPSGACGTFWLCGFIKPLDWMSYAAFSGSRQDGRGRRRFGLRAVFLFFHLLRCSRIVSVVSVAMSFPLYLMPPDIICCAGGRLATNTTQRMCWRLIPHPLAPSRVGPSDQG